MRNFKQVLSEIMDYRCDIQDLRALAVLMVFVFHINAGWLSGGFCGVSGFLISTIILSRR